MLDGNWGCRGDTQTEERDGAKMKPLGGGGITTATGTVMDNGIGNAGCSVMLGELGHEHMLLQLQLQTLFVLHGMREHHEAAKWLSSVMPGAKPNHGSRETSK
ncbi:hypothetical protein HD554DRAFT_2044444 [Boletus coccyginus]|nr:hypothetical protein HD554DRAFT_2044444 [Boletus coccyginus]